MSLSVSCDTRPRIYRTAPAANPRPRPAVGIFDEAGGDGILQDVRQRRLEMLVVLDQFRGETLAEDVVAAAVEGVERARVLPVEVAHAGGEVRLACLDDEVVMIAHQAPGMEAPPIALDDAPQLVQEDASVVVVQEAELLVVAAGRDVVPRARGEVAAASGHWSEGSGGESVGTALGESWRSLVTRWSHVRQAGRPPRHGPSNSDVSGAWHRTWPEQMPARRRAVQFDQAGPFQPVSLPAASGARHRSCRHRTWPEMTSGDCHSVTCGRTEAPAGTPRRAPFRVCALSRDR
jgi:hypothetical protein